MGQRKNRVKAWLTRALEIPPDVMLKQGQCIIKKKNLVIKAILPEEILLEGTIDHVRYVDS